MIPHARQAVFAVGLLALALAGFAAPTWPTTVVGKVVAVHDGDTITVLEGTTQFKIRLDGIDAPELTQAYGRVAKEFASGFAFAKLAEVRVKGMDLYGRYIGEVFIEGRSLNREIVRAGLAWFYVQYSKDKDLATLEAIARASKAGLWLDPHPVPPWEYRKKK